MMFLNGFILLSFFQSGLPWNPSLTKCLTDFYAKDIFNPLSPGCSLVQPLSELGYLPKRAGWKSETQQCFIFQIACDIITNKNFHFTKL